MYKGNQFHCGVIRLKKACSDTVLSVCNVTSSKVIQSVQKEMFF